MKKNVTHQQPRAMTENAQKNLIFLVTVVASTQACIRGKRMITGTKRIRKSEGAAPLYIIIRENRVMARTFVGHRGSASVFLVSVCKRGRRGGRLSGPLWCQAPSRILEGAVGRGGGGT